MNEDRIVYKFSQRVKRAPFRLTKTLVFIGDDGSIRYANAGDEVQMALPDGDLVMRVYGPESVDIRPSPNSPDEKRSADALPDGNALA